MPQPHEGELKLMLAVLETAIDDYRRYNPHTLTRFARYRRAAYTKRFREAQIYLFADSEEWYFSAENVCAILGWNLGYIRRGLKLNLPWERVRTNVIQKSRASVIDVTTFNEQRRKPRVTEDTTEATGAGRPLADRQHSHHLRRDLVREADRGADRVRLSAPQSSFQSALTGELAGSDSTTAP